MKRSAPLQRRTPLRSKPKAVVQCDRVRAPVKRVEVCRGVYRPVTAAAPLPSAERPKPRIRRPRATDLEREHMGGVKRLRCVLCARLGLDQESITDVHHLREEQGGAQRASNWLVAALCHLRCHQGPTGIHGDRSLLRMAKCTEIDLLAWTLQDLAEEGKVR